MGGGGMVDALTVLGRSSSSPWAAVRGLSTRDRVIARSCRFKSCPPTPFGDGRSQETCLTRVSPLTIPCSSLREQVHPAPDKGNSSRCFEGYRLTQVRLLSVPHTRCLVPLFRGVAHWQEHPLATLALCDGPMLEGYPHGLKVRFFPPRPMLSFELARVVIPLSATRSTRVENLPQRRAE